MTTNAIWNLINDLNKKSGITEILINGPKHVFVERGGQFIQLNANLPATDINDFILEVATMNQKVCDHDHPIFDGNLPDGSRINIINEPFVQGSPAISIRKYLKFISSFDNNPTVFGLTPKWIEFFKALMSAKLNVVVSGGTGRCSRSRGRGRRPPANGAGAALHAHLRGAAGRSRPPTGTPAWAGHVVSVVLMQLSVGGHPQLPAQLLT
jgi:hypothetical protein